jgi:hypothetical protein
MAIKKPADFGAYVFRETLVNKGLEVNGNIFCSRGNCNLIKDPSSLNTGRGAASLTTLAVYFSPKLSEIIKVVTRSATTSMRKTSFSPLQRKSARKQILKKQLWQYGRYSKKQASLRKDSIWQMVPVFPVSTL